jgi:hypothetical protein
MLVAFFVAVAMNFISYWFSDRWCSPPGAQPIEAAAPRLYAIVHRLVTAPASRCPAST